jgi:hypothetical protein
MRRIIVKTKTILAVALLVGGSVGIQFPADAQRGSGGGARHSSPFSLQYSKEEGGPDVQSVRFVFFGENCTAWTLTTQIPNNSKIVIDPLKLDQTPPGVKLAATVFSATDESFLTGVSSNGLQGDRIKSDGSIVSFDTVRSRQPVGTLLDGQTFGYGYGNTYSRYPVFVYSRNDTEALSLDAPTDGSPQLIADHSENSIILGDTLTKGDWVTPVVQNLRLKLSSHYTPEELRDNMATIRLEAWQKGELIGESDPQDVECISQINLLGVLKPKNSFANSTLEGAKDVLLKVIRTDRRGPGFTHKHGEHGAIESELRESTARGPLTRDLHPGGPIARGLIELVLDQDDYPCTITTNTCGDTNQ